MIDTEIMEPGADSATLAKWAPVLEGIEDSYTQRVTAQLLENQAKAIMSEKLDDVVSKYTKNLPQEVSMNLPKLKNRVIIVDKKNEEAFSKYKEEHYKKAEQQ